ncbi:putative trypsin-6 [Xiphias gladius]|uniref:putative trypsin-6 n=1 Tax=Xiphias gladius TaxID=8245 RepID=UPI001A9999C8|nr:putative trypsin-6 [Xiphias gladius]
MASMTPLLLLLWVCVTVSAGVDLQKRIIGGHTCGPEERLYHVRLEIVQGVNSFRCGGSLISDRWILTAAHCWEPGETIYAEIGVHQGTGERVKIQEQPEIYSEKDKDNKIKSHDIMLLKLDKATTIKPIVLPECLTEPPAGSEVQIAGHGRSAVDKNMIMLKQYPNTLLCAELNVVSCNSIKVPLFIRHPYENWLCLDQKGKDSCRGDSGGGLVYKDMIYGIVNGGHPTIACPGQPVEIKAPPEIYTDTGKNNKERSYDIMQLKLPIPTHI